METTRQALQSSKELILSLIENDNLTSYFQPIFSAIDGHVFAYEALCRLKPGVECQLNIEQLFNTSISLGLIAHLDFHCRDSAMKEAIAAGITHTDAMLFINICPETIQSPEYQPGLTDELAECWGLGRERIVLEITEQSAVKNWRLFRDAVQKYRARGYRIAIDDFGAGYGGLKMLSLIKPDFIKIDRHFISQIQTEEVNRTMVESFITLCHKLGIKVIAEGIETEDECAVVRMLGSDHLQGYHLGRPAPHLSACASVKEFDLIMHDEKNTQNDIKSVGDIIDSCASMLPTRGIFDIFRAFIADETLGAIAIVEDGKPIGMVYRKQFMEKHFIGKYGYGMHLNAHIQIKHIMKTDYIMVESILSIDDVAKRLQLQRHDTLMEDICVTENGYYKGSVSANALIAAIAERNIVLARGANPLTGLPGNISIEAEISQRIALGEEFSACYIDIDNFKPFNDHYGFERGDIVIKTLAEILNTVKDGLYGNNSVFAGHVGGDDFIILCNQSDAYGISEDVIGRFSNHLQSLHGDTDFSVGQYIAISRKGEEEVFRLLSLSIGIVSTGAHPVESYAHLASIASEVKKAAKRIEGNSIVRDRRAAM